VRASIGVKLNATADLGDTKIYRYDGKRIKFEDGKVTEIQ
jgi:phage gp45-like